MSILGHLIVLAFALNVNAQDYQWIDIDNICTQIEPEGTQQDIEGVTPVEYWSLPSDRCISLTYTPYQDNTYLASVNVDPTNPNYAKYHTTAVSVENPNTPGQLEAYAINGAEPVRVTSIAVYEPNVCYGLAICPYQNGSIPATDIRRYVLCDYSASAEQIEDIKNRLEAKVNGLPLNKVESGLTCLTR
ncbi:hypothetical protein CHUAL_000242 [Chamberlinius hualienensis]